MGGDHQLHQPRGGDPAPDGGARFGPVDAGLLSTAFFVTLAVACVPAGVLSDRLGPTRVGTAGLAAVFASNLARWATRATSRTS